MRRLPVSYVALASALGVVAVFVALVYFAIPPFDNLATFILTSAVGFVLLLVFGVVGGAFAGMLLAHRMLANREFTPFERTVIEGLAEVRDRLDRLEKEP